MGARGPSPAYDVGAFVLAVEMGASHATLAKDYEITLKAVERRIHRLRQNGALRPAPGRDRPGGWQVEQRAARAAERLERRLEHDRRAEQRKVEWAAVKAEAQAKADAEAAERERFRLAEEASHLRRRAELEWHAQRQSSHGTQGPVLDLLG